MDGNLRRSTTPAQTNLRVMGGAQVAGLVVAEAD
jgi:hypothetical protein